MAPGGPVCLAHAWLRGLLPGPAAMPKPAVLNTMIMLLLITLVNSQYYTGQDGGHQAPQMFITDSGKYSTKYFVIPNTRYSFEILFF